MGRGATRLLESAQVELAYEPADLNGAGANGDWVSMANYRQCTFLSLYGDGTAGSDPNYTVQQATDNAATGVKALTNMETGRIYRKIAATYALYAAVGSFSEVAQATVANTYAPTDNGEAVGMDVLVIRAEDLDADNGFDHIRVNTSDPGAAKVMAGVYILTDPRDHRAPASMATVI
jgi:hypothetical protein